MTFERGAVLGTGMMGPGIALTLSLGGVDAAIVGRTEESAARGLNAALAQLALLAGHGLVDAAAANGARERLTATADRETAVAAADIVIESTPEQMAFKQELFQWLDAATRPDCVLASNTSGLSITAIAEGCRHPERILTTHFWNPPHLMALVEVVMGERTSPNVATAVRELLARCGKVPVLVRRDTPGQLGNRMQMALVREAAHIVAEGIASAEDVDLAARMGFGQRLPVYGVLEHQDVVGLDMGLAITDYVASDLYSRPQAPPYYHELVAAGHLGAKTGQGFHAWPAGKLEEVKARRDGFLLQMRKWFR